MKLVVTKATIQDYKNMKKGVGVSLEKMEDIKKHASLFKEVIRGG